MKSFSSKPIWLSYFIKFLAPLTSELFLFLWYFSIAYRGSSELFKENFFWFIFKIPFSPSFTFTSGFDSMFSFNNFESSILSSWELFLIVLKNTYFLKSISSDTFFSEWFRKQFESILASGSSTWRFLMVWLIDSFSTLYRLIIK